MKRKNGSLQGHHGHHLGATPHDRGICASIGIRIGNIDARHHLKPLNPVA